MWPPVGNKVAEKITGFFSKKPRNFKNSLAFLTKLVKTVEPIELMSWWWDCYNWFYYRYILTRRFKIRLVGCTDKQWTNLLTIKYRTERPGAWQVRGEIRTDELVNFYLMAWVCAMVSWQSLCLVGFWSLKISIKTYALWKCLGQNAGDVTELPVFC